MASTAWTCIAIASACACPLVAHGSDDTPGQATHERIMRRPAAASPAPLQSSPPDAPAGPRGPGNSRDTPMPASGQDTTVMQPVESGIADRGALSQSLRQMPITLRMPGAFENVFPVPGRPGLFFRAQGGLYVVFDEATYRFYRGTNYATIPPGAVFYVGRPDWSKIPMPWFRGLDAPDPDAQGAGQPSAAGAAPVQALVDHEVDPAGESPSRLRSDRRVQVRRADVGGDLGRVPGHRAGFGTDSPAPDELDSAARALATRSASERDRDAAASRAPDAAAIAGVLPAGVSRELLVVDSEGEVRPRIVGDVSYRRQRIAELMRVAALGPRRATPQSSP
jgi:hypothetical protein